MPQPHLNSFYRIWFTTIDPIVIVLTITGCITDPPSALAMIISPEFLPYNAAINPIIYQLATLFGFLGIISGVLLRASSDPKVWRIVQGAVLAVDCSLLCIMYVMLKQQGRLSLEMWKPLDWSSALFTVWVAVIRAAFLMGIGGGDGGKKRV